MAYCIDTVNSGRLIVDDRTPILIEPKITQVCDTIEPLWYEMAHIFYSPAQWSLHKGIYISGDQSVHRQNRVYTVAYLLFGGSISNLVHISPIMTAVGDGVAYFIFSRKSKIWVQFCNY